jgi:hypothetical protein
VRLIGRCGDRRDDALFSLEDVLDESLKYILFGKEGSDGRGLKQPFSRTSENGGLRACYRPIGIGRNNLQRVAIGQHPTPTIGQQAPAKHPPNPSATCVLAHG